MSDAPATQTRPAAEEAAVRAALLDRPAPAARRGRPPPPSPSAGGGC